MHVRELKPAKPMDSGARALAKAAVARLSEEPLTEPAVYIRLVRLPRRQYRALCALAGSDEPHEVVDLAMRVAGVKPASPATRQRLAECDG